MDTALQPLVSLDAAIPLLTSFVTALQSQQPLASIDTILQTLIFLDDAQQPTIFADTLFLNQPSFVFQLFTLLFSNLVRGYGWF
jgi:hypothetical protein